MVSKIMYSSKDSEWGTPRKIFDPIDDIFGFNLDVCANTDNARVDRFISKEENAFLVDWSVGSGKTVAWMNPPYGKPEKKCVIPNSKCKKKTCYRRGYHIDEDRPGLYDWVYRAFQQTLVHDLLLVSLIPARTDAEWFQLVFSRSLLICFVRGRINFDGAAKDAAPFPSVIAVFSSEDLDTSYYERMTEFGNVIDPREGQILVYGGH
jgi:phage N-6-adenine-methyltransferase